MQRDFYTQPCDKREMISSIDASDARREHCILAARRQSGAIGPPTVSVPQSWWGSNGIVQAVERSRRPPRAVLRLPSAVRIHRKQDADKDDVPPSAD